MRTGVHQHHTDDLAVMAEDDLNRNLRRAQEQLGSMRREGQGAELRRYAEVEVCYLQRETDVRESRRRAHQRWLSRGANPAAAPRPPR